MPSPPPLDPPPVGVVREREEPLREADPPRERELALRGDLAPPLERLAVERALLAPELERLAAERDFVAAELERGLAFDALDRDLVFDPLERDFVFDALERDLLAPLDFARDVLLRLGVDLRAPLPRDELDERLAGLAALDPSSLVHLPDNTRCAASATASAMIDPSFVALETTLVAACDAVSAASSPASRILRRAAGLALIAAAAAARPAASISLLIAALVSLSTVLAFDLEAEPANDDLDDEDRGDLDDLEELFRADFAIALTPSVG